MKGLYLLLLATGALIGLALLNLLYVKIFVSYGDITVPVQNTGNEKELHPQPVQTLDIDQTDKVVDNTRTQSEEKSSIEALNLLDISSSDEVLSEDENDQEGLRARREGENIEHIQHAHKSEHVHEHHDRDRTAENSHDNSEVEDVTPGEPAEVISNYEINLPGFNHTNHTKCGHNEENNTYGENESVSENAPQVPGITPNFTEPEVSRNDDDDKAKVHQDKEKHEKDQKSEKKHKEKKSEKQEAAEEPEEPEDNHKKQRQVSEDNIQVDNDSDKDDPIQVNVTIVKIDEYDPATTSNIYLINR